MRQLKAPLTLDPSPVGRGEEIRFDGSINRKPLTGFGIGTHDNTDRLIDDVILVLGGDVVVVL
jgi:hypothetical protein